MARQTIQAACALPAQVAKVVLPYLGLFRPEKQALRWSKSLKLINELSAMIAPGYIQIQGKAARPCPPHLWAQALDQMAERRPTLTLPLKNHNYLRQVAYQIADQADAGRERQQHQQVLNGNVQANRDMAPPAPVQMVDGLSQIERQWLDKYGNLPGDAGAAGDAAVNTLAGAWKRRDASQHGGD